MPMRKPEIWLGGAGLALLASMAKCSESVDSGIHTKENSFEDSEPIVRDTRRRIASVWEEMADTENSDVIVKLDFKSMDETHYLDTVLPLSDCIESTGQYVCRIQGTYKASCYPVDPEEEGIPVYIYQAAFRDILPNGDRGPQMSSIYHGVQTSMDFDYYPEKDPEDTQEKMEDACRDALDFFSEPMNDNQACPPDDLACFASGPGISFSLLDSMPFSGLVGAQLLEGSDSLYDTLSEQGFDVKDQGGQRFQFEWDGKLRDVSMNFAPNFDPESEEADSPFDLFYRVRHGTVDEATYSFHQDIDDLISSL